MEKAALLDENLGAACYEMMMDSLSEIKHTWRIRW
jgi:hypothetical protein